MAVSLGVCGSGWVKSQSDRPWTPPRSFLWKASWRGCGAYGASSSSPPRTASFLFEDASLYINRSLGYYSCEKVRQNYVAVKRQNPNTNNDNKTNTVTTVDLYVKQVVQGATSRPLLEQLSVKDCESSTVLHRHMVVFEKPESYAKTLRSVVSCPQFARLYAWQKTSWVRVVGFEFSRVLAFLLRRTG